ncbi:MAG: type IV toxin-antitoxin system AbiEi family antitoxin [Bacteroidales bacterium]
MKHKTLKDPSAILLAELNAQDKQFFNVNEAKQILSSSDPRAVNELLRQMVSRGLLMRIKDGLYHIIPYDKASDTYQPDWHITASHLVENGDYYIGYYSALSIHSLTTQPALKEQIVISKRQQKKSLQVKNIEYQFVYHNQIHFFGAKNTWIDSFNKVKCSDIEKTFIDCLFMPFYAGGIVEIAKALFKARTNIDFQKLHDYSIQFGNQSVIKRLGYLLELLEISTPLIKKLFKFRTEAFTLLDPSLPKEGKMASRWRIQQNIDPETILSSLGN